MTVSGWLDGIERVPNDHSGGGTYADGVPWRFVVHTVEGDPDNVSDCRLIAGSHRSPPHLWYSPRLGWYGQTVPLDRSAFALAHPPGTAETNKMRALQVEVFGYAAETQDWPPPWLDGIGYLVRRCVNAGYPVNLEHVAPTTGEDGYGHDGAVRFSPHEWTQWDGLCGHANVPANDHWDPGAADLAAVARAARPPAPEPPEDDLPVLFLMSCPDVGLFTLVDTSSGLFVDFSDGGDVDAYSRADIPTVGPVSADHRTRISQMCAAVRGAAPAR